MDRLSALVLFNALQLRFFLFYRSCSVSCLLAQLVARRKRKSNKASRLSRFCAAAAEFKPLTTLRRSLRHTAQHILVGVRVHTYQASHRTKWHQAPNSRVQQRKKRVASGSSPHETPTNDVCHPPSQENIILAPHVICASIIPLRVVHSRSIFGY